MSNRKWCFVPKCTSTSSTTPQKIFVSVPKAAAQRKKWFDAARRDVKSVSSTSTMYCCEDHFDLEKDMENYLQYKMSTVRARMNPNIAPHKFACQLSSTKRVFSEKRARQKHIAKYLQPAAARRAGPSTEKSEPEGVEVIEEEHDELPEPLTVEVQSQLQSEDPFGATPLQGPSTTISNTNDIPEFDEPESIKIEPIQIKREYYEDESEAPSNKRFCFDDDLSAFGRLVEQKLRMMPTEYGKRLVMQKIEAILHEAESGVYDYPKSDSELPEQCPPFVAVEACVKQEVEES
ncbi:unnamed protein product [Acanthoscelides obtectus]|uniref:THAP-type domain-containing protein n=1 Tax=Acanthoscelides obtectus TaxID=200917 RepID=A0A9P0LRJ6_ACAOB|nr:unnamed protein product [Acanthoscelides obtectus]CAK1657408.1 hypothetical protein AOBTE_LOCUS20331 [Acanthoscelides obtectus]